MSAGFTAGIRDIFPYHELEVENQKFSGIGMLCLKQKMRKLRKWKNLAPQGQILLLQAEKASENRHNFGRKTFQGG